MKNRVRIKRVVYMATNVINGKRYIGATKQGLATRKYFHLYWARVKRPGCRIFGAAIRKYGEESFLWTILDYAQVDKELIEKEIYWIDKLDPEYNITIGGLGVIGAPRTKEWRENQSKALKGRLGPRYWLGKHHSQETKEKISLSKKGRKNPFAVVSEECRRAADKTNCKPVICLDDGLNFGNLRSACVHYGLNLSDGQICNGHRTIHANGRFRGRRFVYSWIG